MKPGPQCHSIDQSAHACRVRNPLSSGSRGVRLQWWLRCQVSIARAHFDNERLHVKHSRLPIRCFWGRVHSAKALHLFWIVARHPTSTAPYDLLGRGSAAHQFESAAKSPKKKYAPLRTRTPESGVRSKPPGLRAHTLFFQGSVEPGIFFTSSRATFHARCTTQDSER